MKIQKSINKLVSMFLFISLFILAGCNITPEKSISSYTNNTVQNNISTELVDIVDNSSRACFISKDCQDGFHCFKGECINNDVLKNFLSCEEKVCANGACGFNVCLQNCENCEKGKMSCMLSSEEIKNNLCIECFMDLQCKEGYMCKNYICVK